MRLFFAVDFEYDIKTRMAEILRAARAAGAEGRFVPPENLHLTLAFLGEVPPSRLSALREIAQGIEFEAFDLSLIGVGSFKRPEGDVFWLGVEKSEPLEQMVRQLRAGTAARGFAAEDRAFRPHVTLGRKVRFPADFPSEKLSEAARQIRVPVRSFELMRSDFTGGVRYTVVFSKKCGE